MKPTDGVALVALLLCACRGAPEPTQEQAASAPDKTRAVVATHKLHLALPPLLKPGDPCDDPSAPPPAQPIVGCGPLSRAQIRAALTRGLPALDACLAAPPDQVPGALTLSWRIMPGGEVAAAKREHADPPHDTALRACLTAALTTIGFPRPLGGGVVDVHMPFQIVAADGSLPDSSPVQTPSATERSTPE